MLMSDYKPGVYVKGPDVRIADNAREAVALVFDGYRRQGEVPQDDGSASYKSLQEQAKALGVSASGSKEDLEARVLEAQKSSADA